MRIFTRISDIISANLNDVIDRFEDPETMLNQAVREMEQALDSTTDAAAKAIAGERLLSRQLDAQRTEIDRQERLARDAVHRGDDAAARAALVAGHERARLVAALEDELDAAKSSSGKLRRQIAAMHVRLGEARRKLLVLSARQQAAAARKRLVREVGEVGGATAAFGRFDRLAERIERGEAEADALVELSRLGARDPFDFGAIDGFDAQVEDELARLKREGTAGDAR
ncbi:MAG: PspA/IM30 family protein [Planctomycetales bacterium]